MKKLLAWLGVLGLIVAGTYFVVSQQKASQFAKELALLKSGWDAERTELEAALHAAKQNRASAAPAANAPAPDGGPFSSPHDILEKLKKMKVGSGEQRNPSVRQIIHQLESLVDYGTDALPAIREFLGKFEDVDYSSEPRPEDKGVFREADRTMPTATLTIQNAPRLDSMLPPSLRLGIVQVLREIGGEPAEQVLSEMLSTSGRGVEVAYVARVLQEMVPNKYKDVAVAAAKDLLANPPNIDRPNRLDENSKNYLYGVLSMYSDPTFANTAQGQLVTQDGRVDRTALTYLTGALKDDSVPALYQAFKDSRLTNLWERASLASQIFSYAGSSQQANDIFKEVVGNESLPSWLRATAIQTVAGGQGPLFGGAAPTDAAQIKARIDLLNGLPEISDERLARARMEAVQKLMANLESIEGASGRSFRTRLDDAVGQASAPPAPGATGK